MKEQIQNEVSPCSQGSVPRIKYADKIAKLCLLDDVFMTAVFDGDTALTELVVRIILGRDDLHVQQVVTQKELKNLKGHSIRLDIYAVDDTGRHYDIEIQRTNEGAGSKRARYNLGLLDGYTLQAGENYSDLGEAYIIFITEQDVLGQGLPLYHIERMILETGELFGDEAHIVYANASYVGDDAFGKLMADFRSSDPSEMHYPELAERIGYWKNSEQGGIGMSNVIEEIVEEMKDDWLKEGRVAGQVEGEASGQIIGAIKVYKDFGLTAEAAIEKIVEKFQLSREEAAEKVALYW